MFETLRSLKQCIIDINREIDLAENLRVCRQRLHHHVHDVIERRSQLVNRVAEGESAFSRWCSGNWLERDLVAPEIGSE